MKLPIKPMLAEPGPTPDGDRFPPVFDRDDHAFEIKYDGYRAIAVNDGKRTVLYSRPRTGAAPNDITHKWPEIAAEIPANSVLDGEIIALRNGQPSFQALQNIMRGPRTGLRFVAFDILERNGMDMQNLSYLQRRVELAEAVSSNVVIMAGSVSDGRAAWATVLEHGLEGLISKPVKSRYVQDNRGIWTKHKRNVVQVFDVVGYTSGDGSRSGAFGALLLGEQVDGQLRYAGKCGTGFTSRTIQGVLAQLHAHRTDTPSLPPAQLARARMHLGGRAVTWVKPGLAATVEFNDFTDDRTVRMGSFKGLVGKPAEEVEKMAIAAKSKPKPKAVVSYPKPSVAVGVRTPQAGEEFEVHDRLREAGRSPGTEAALDALADLRVEAGNVVNEVIRGRIDALTERITAGVQYAAWDWQDRYGRLLAAIDAVLATDPDADPVPEDEWDPVFIELRDDLVAALASPVPPQEPNHSARNDSNEQ